MELKAALGEAATDEPYAVARWLWSAHARGLIEGEDPHFLRFRVTAAARDLARGTE